MFNAEVESINKVLSERYGKTLTGLPFFRVVWSDDLYELRNGTYNIFYGKVFVKEEKGVRRVRKYNYIQQRWIMEKWCPPWMVQTDEIINHDGYEPIYVFEDKNGNFLNPNLRVATYIAYNLLNPTYDRGRVKQSIDAEIDKQFKDDVAYFEDQIEDRDNLLRFNLRHGDSILAPGPVKGEN